MTKFNQFIEFINSNKDWIRPIWFALGLIGLYIMKTYTRPSFYKNKPLYWWIYLIIFYMAVGGMIFIMSCLTLINPDRKQ